MKPKSEMKDSRQLNDKVIAITGGCGDIGGATARKLSDLGATVVLLDLLDPKAGQSRMRELRASSYMKVDQSKTDELQGGIADIARQFGKLDVVIGNAGVGPGGNLLDLTDADWEGVLAGEPDWVRTIGPGRGTADAFAEAGQSNKDPWKGIVHEFLGRRLPFSGSHSLLRQQAGLNHLVRLMAQEFAAKGILANAVAPGILNAGLTKKAAFQRDPKLRRKYLDYIPLGEFGTADQVADAFVFLCSAESNYMTGQILVVDGGCTLTKRV